MKAERLTFPEAWSTIPAFSAETKVSSRFTSTRMERILAIVMAVGAAVLGVQAFLEALGGIRSASSMQVALLVVVLASLAAAILTCALGRGVRAANGLFAVVYLFALVLWPFLAGADRVPGGAQPWIFFLVNIAAFAAVLAFSMPLQIVMVVVLPFGYGFARLRQGGFSQGSWIEIAFDVSFTLILGVVLLAMAWVFRQVAAGVDEARATAVAGSGEAAAEAAAEEEKVAVAALMHDSVLAALLAAERAASPRERELAVAMAREALTRLAHTEESIALEGSDAPIAWEQVVIELRRMLSELGADAVVEVCGESPEVPERVARAAVLAARQACMNAMEHARGRGLHILVEGRARWREEGFAITVSDTGPGFSMDEVPADRLGLRASVIARMAAVAGSASIESDAQGTVVRLTWQRG